MQAFDEDEPLRLREVSKDRKALARAIMLEPSTAQKSAICRLELIKTSSDLWEIQIQGEDPTVAEVRHSIPSGSNQAKCSGAANRRIKMDEVAAIMLRHDPGLRQQFAVDAQPHTAKN